MLFIKRAASAIAVLALLVLSALYLPSPISTAAWIILGLFALVLFLPLLLSVIGMVFDSEEDGLLENLLESYFLWNALEWPWLVLKWVFTRRRPDPEEGRKRAEEPPFDREA